MATYTGGWKIHDLNILNVVLKLGKSYSHIINGSFSSTPCLITGGYSKYLLQPFYGELVKTLLGEDRTYLLLCILP